MTTTMKPATIVLDRTERGDIYRVRAGRKGTGRQIAVILDRGYNFRTIIEDLTYFAAQYGYEAKVR